MPTMVPRKNFTFVISETQYQKKKKKKLSSNFKDKINLFMYLKLFFASCTYVVFIYKGVNT